MKGLVNNNKVNAAIQLGRHPLDAMVQYQPVVVLSVYKTTLLKHIETGW